MIEIIIIEIIRKCKKKKKLKNYTSPANVFLLHTVEAVGKLKK